MFIAKLLTAVIAGRTIASNLRGGRGVPVPAATGAAPSSSRFSPPAGAKRAAAGAETESSSAQEDAISAQQAGEAGPDSPLELQSDDWRATLKRTLAEIKADRVTLVAAGMAYYFFLAIFPALIAFIGVLGLVQADYEELTRRESVASDTEKVEDTGT